MPVGLGRLPSERRELLRQGIERGMGDGGSPETLKVVVIDCGDNVRTAERGSHHDRLPGRAFLHLAVAEHDVDDPIGLAAAFGQRHSDRHGETVTKRARRGLDARVAVIRMAAEPAVGLAIIVEIPAAQHAGFLQNDVLNHAAMALGHQKSVGRGTIQIATHERVVHAVNDLGA